MRNAEFDKQAVLRHAMITFMEYGYAKTSMQKLTQATGLHPGSIYCAFGNKQGLLLQAIAQYQQDKNEEFLSFFTNTATVIDNLSAYLHHIVEQCTRCDTSKVCLLSKTLSEVSGHDPTIMSVLTDNIETYQQALTAQFSQAIDNKEITSDKSAQELAQFFAMGIYGLRTYSQSHPDPEVLARLAQQLLACVCQR